MTGQRTSVVVVSRVSQPEMCKVRSRKSVPNREMLRAVKERWPRNDKKGTQNSNAKEGVSRKKTTRRNAGDGILFKGIEDSSEVWLMARWGEVIVSLQLRYREVKHGWTLRSAAFAGLWSATCAS